MKKALISLLLGVTLVGGLVGCGNKPVVEDKEVNTPIVEEETLENQVIFMQGYMGILRLRAEIEGIDL